MTAPAPPRRPRPPAARKAAPPPVTPIAPTSSRTFQVVEWAGRAAGGRKIILYGPTGMGKTTLGTMLPDPLFVGLDDGGRMIRHPVTGRPVRAVLGIETFDDLRAVLRQTDLFHGIQTLVVDTITMAEQLATAHVLAHVKIGNDIARNIEDYGYGKGYRFMTDTMRLLLPDLDALVRSGLNICLLAQEQAAKISNAEGVDILQFGPRLYHGTRDSVRNDYTEWADHVLRVTLLNRHATTRNKEDRVGKILTTDQTRIIQTEGAGAFLAKHRAGAGEIPPVVAFDEPADASIWQFIFGGDESDG